MGRADQLQGGDPLVPGRETFPRTARLTSPRDFREVFDHGRRAVGQAFVCYVAEGQGRKMGMAVSKKVGDAVTRNRVKRYIREIFRHERASLREGLRIVVVARTAAAGLTYAESREALRRLFRQGGALGE